VTQQTNPLAAYIVLWSSPDFVLRIVSSRRRERGEFSIRDRQGKKKQPISVRFSCTSESTDLTAERKFSRTWSGQTNLLTQFPLQGENKSEMDHASAASAVMSQQGSKKSAEQAKQGPNSRLKQENHKKYSVHDGWITDSQIQYFSCLCRHVCHIPKPQKGAPWPATLLHLYGIHAYTEYIQARTHTHTHSRTRLFSCTKSFWRVLNKPTHAHKHLA
jgi:hypothetical protein